MPSITAQSRNCSEKKWEERAIKGEKEKRPFSYYSTGQERGGRKYPMSPISIRASWEGGGEGGETTSISLTPIPMASYQSRKKRKKSRPFDLPLSVQSGGMS